MTTKSRSRSWTEARAAKAAQISDRDRTAARIHLDAQLAAHALAEIRRSQRRSQAEVGDVMGVGQRRVSAIESAALKSAELGTIASYVSALGGQLRLIADFGERSVIIQDGVLSESSGPSARRRKPRAGISSVSAPALPLCDEIDGGAADEVVRFGLDGVQYVINLNARNARALRGELFSFIRAARPAGAESAAKRIGVVGSRMPKAQSVARKVALPRLAEDGDRGAAATMDEQNISSVTA